MKCPKCHNDNPDTSRFCGSCAEVLNSEKQPLPSFTKTIETPAHALSKDSLIAGKYRIVGEIGRGGMGVVYKAEDIKLRRTVALKFLPAQWTADPDARERFVHEAQAASALDHPNICNVHEIEETEDGRMYIAMACYEGESLRDMLKRGPLPPEEALKIAIQAAEGMSAAHAKGIVHRDIKPANMLIAAQGIVKVVDFGLAKLAGQVKLTREGTTLGTVAYMSPEQARGEAVDQRTDIWSLGVVLYEMLAGVLPFAGEVDRALINAILHREPAPLSKSKKELPAGLENIVFKALRTNPSDRYQQMDEMLADLQAVAEGLKPLKAGPGIFRGRILGIKKTYAYPALVGTVVLAALAILFVFPKRGQAFDSIAVLPIANQSGDPEQDLFCDSVHRDLITELSRIKAIRTVIAKQTMMAFKGTAKKSSEIALELNVAAVISCEARRTGDAVEIVFELIDGQNDKLLGGDKVEGNYQDILKLQGEMAVAIARKIQSKLTPEETRALSEKKRVIPEAYDAYLRGMAIVGNVSQIVSPEDILKSIPRFKQALKIDPDFAPGYAGLALAYDYGASFGAGLPKEMFPKAIEAAKKALSLDDSLADASLVLADAKMVFEWDFAGGEKEFRRLLEQYPNHALAHTWYAVNVISNGRGAKADILFHLARAKELDPLNYSIGEMVVSSFWMIREYDMAILQAKEEVRLHPGFPPAHMGLAQAYSMAGRLDDALAESQKSTALGSPPDAGWLAQFYARAGDRSKAEKYVGDLLRGQNEMVKVIHLPVIYALLGDKDKAFEWLEKSYELRNPGIVTARVHPDADNLRSDSRFAALMKKIGLDK